MPLSTRSSCFMLPLAALVAAPFSVPAPLNAQADRAQGEMVKLTFPNADIRDVLTQYELLVGKHIIYDNTVQGQVNINVPEVPKEEAIRIIEITLLMNGYHLVPSDSDPNLIKATGIGRSPRQVGVPILAEPEPIPEGEQVIMYLVKLQYADPTELSQVLQQAMPASRQEYAPNIVPLPKAQSIIITENTAILRGVMKIIRAADLEPTRVEGEFITLQRASAKDVVQMLEKLFEKPQASPGGAAPRPVAQPAPAPAAGGQPGAAPPSQLTTVELGGGMNEDSMLSGKVRLTADERTNRIYVVTRPVNIPVIRKLVQEFDLDVPFSEPMVRPLKFVSAGDILDALVKAVSDPGTKDVGTTGATGAQGQRSQTPTPAQSASPFGNQANRGAGGSSSPAQSLSLQTEPREIIPQTVLVGNARIMADKRRNAILVIGSADIKEKVSNILQQLDVRTPQVMLTTVIGELTLSEGEEFGASYLLRNGKRSALDGTVLNSGTSDARVGLVNGASNALSLNLAGLLSSTSKTRILTGGAGGLGGFVAAGDSLGALVNALESTTKFKVTSRPSLFASNNKRAQIISGERIAVIQGTQTQPGLGSNSSLVQQNQVSYIDVNLDLQVVPLINSDKEVYLEVAQTIAEVTSYSKIGGDDYPVISNRQLQTAVMVPNEGTLVLGGLIKDIRNKTTGGVPVLSKIPVLGGLFRSTSTKKNRTELVVLIRPSVTVGPEDTYEIRDRNMKPLKIPVNLEDDLTVPEPSGKRKSTAVSDKDFRTNPAGVRTADEADTSSPKTQPPAGAAPVKIGALGVGKDAAKESDKDSKKDSKKKGSTPQTEVGAQ